MAREKDVSPQGTNSPTPYTDPAPAPTMDTASNDIATDTVNANREETAVDYDEENKLKHEQPANPEDEIDALGIPDWRDLEKKLVTRLDITLMPCLWVLYLFNYLDRASIACVHRLRTIKLRTNKA